MKAQRAHRRGKRLLDPGQREHELAKVLLLLLTAVSRFAGSNKHPPPTAARFEQ